MHRADCIFCQIAQGHSPCHPIWEDERHLAFLSIFPNTKGFSVVITREHHGSDAFAADETVLAGLVLAAQKTAKVLDRAFDDVGRTGLILEGFGVDHLHAKLFPMHGTAGLASGQWQPINSGGRKYFEKYEGYISSHDCERASDVELAALAAHIRRFA